MAKPGLLTLTIKDKSALYLAYMPFVINGGLFIPTNSSYRLGDEVFMLLNLMGEDEKIPVAGTVSSAIRTRGRRRRKSKPTWRVPSAATSQPTRCSAPTPAHRQLSRAEIPPLRT